MHEQAFTLLGDDPESSTRTTNMPRCIKHLHGDSSALRRGKSARKVQHLVPSTDPGRFTWHFQPVPVIGVRVRDGQRRLYEMHNSAQVASSRLTVISLNLWRLAED